ncbi:MAG: glycoside hydrolase family 9 protein [Defluviitaleaceae bacterium]|nr:glycoside hydrolase family 9 protein [Defluviitaleaceae bacterium]
MKKSNGFFLNNAIGYFQNHGVDVMAFDDFYPEGHQSGVSIIMHGNRVASNGDVRMVLKDSWPMPKQNERKLDEELNTITTELSFTDLNYKVNVKGAGESVIVSVDLEKPLPQDFPGKVFFNLELFPGALLGKPWIMDKKQGIFPTQANSVGEPYATGKRFTTRPDDPHNRLTIESERNLHLIDGRMYESNGWFIISSEIPAGIAKNALEWTITPNIVEDWKHAPVIQISQVGYHPNQPKTAIIELDKRETNRELPVLFKITETGASKIISVAADEWGQFLRYNYLKFDFTDIKEEGLYKIVYGKSESSVFRVAEDIYDHGVWQPVLEYFLPVQMCHMRVNERTRVWHDLCHMDDAKMAPINHIHFDGYEQGPSTLTKYKPGESVPGLNVGGWHDAGDDDLRIESQSGECYILAMAYESFGINHDVTTVDQEKKVTEIHRPDGKNDILQQIEHGALSVVGAYRSLGRLYRGIITNSMKQYALLGDPAAQTDGIIGNDDDRWVFTEDNPPRELSAAAHLAAVSRVLKGFNDALSNQSLEAARELFTVTDINKEYSKPPWVRESCVDYAKRARIHAAVELFLTTNEDEYKNYLLSETEFIANSIYSVGWFVARAEKAICDENFTKAIRDNLPALNKHLLKKSAETPYGIPYRPNIWGAGWEIQRMGFEYYFLHTAYPDIFGAEMVFNALNFILGCHPGSNNMSFASGIGAKSALIAYGWNRADWSFVPGGVISGTALIRPDFPELLEFPFLWQQTEYVMGGGSSHYMFLVLAAQKILKGE